MVGVPRSKGMNDSSPALWSNANPRALGCSLCVQRRVKCDEGRPHCGNCLKYGAECPGFNKSLIFVAAKTHRTRKTRVEDSTKQRSLHVTTTSSSDRSSSPSTEDNGLVLQSKAPSQLQKLPPYHVVFEDFSSPQNVQIQMLTEVTAYFNSRLSSHPGISPVTPVTDWLTEIGNRAYPSTLLTTCAQSLLVHQMGLKLQNPAMLMYSRDAYGRALPMLQASLRHPEAWSSSDTLCSAIILAFFELFNGTDGESWMQHAKGVSRLMQLRGPSRHQDKFDRTMLTAFQGILVSIVYSSCRHLVDSPDHGRLLQWPNLLSIAARMAVLVERDMGRGEAS